MELSYDTVRTILDRTLGGDGEYEYCHEYGEPGYDFTSGATTPLVVLGNYWCRCGKVLEPDPNNPDAQRAALHDYAYHYPRIWARMESQGVQFEWFDEWTIDYDNDKAYRTSGDSYSWQSSIQYTDGDILTPDDDLDRWLEWIAEEPAHRCLHSRVFSSGDLEQAGFASYNGRYENGWHEGMNDNPRAIVDQIHETLGDDVEIVFLLDEASQFNISFSAYTRGQTDETDETDDDDMTESDWDTVYAQRETEARERLGQ